ncbi:two-component hybrid sensor and regulator [Richelia sinica FACHB-800]|uniref:Circadian input-output histidine kinase CikA n=1 Tax=Richelia sinica FACHB-800 TaxID=1357546 RepID=A0A975Y7N0_9NOST|nr:PAS domain S-box protein [Richelia sinica]MBD2665511.1 PAS domain S-box protein [Richelia sinica FACHB-800]QXE26503.1 two-component hybrid sensor and regulator [Richelia sinica FACHB-800]
MPEIVFVSYEPILVACSFLIIVLASYTALDLAGKVTSNTTKRSPWIIGGAVAMGTGIWAMHFIAMSALKLPLAMDYDFTITVISWLDAIIASGLALMLFTLPELNWLVLTGGGVMLGLAITSMHYLGMLGLKITGGTISYNLWLVGLSIVVAIASAILALWLAFRFHRSHQPGFNLQKLYSAIVMGIGITAMHYTGMWASLFQTLPDLPQVNHIPERSLNSWLGLEIAIASLFILIGTLATVFLDRRYAEKLLRQEALEASEKRFRSLIRDMPVGVLLLEPNGKIIFHNPVASQLLSLPETGAENQNIQEMNWHFINENGQPFPPQADPIQLALTNHESLHNCIVGIYNNSPTDVVWLLFNIEPQLAEDNTLERLVCTFINVTTEKKAKEALQESETRFALAIEGTAVGIWDWDLVTNQVYLSSSWKSILGYTNEELPNSWKTWIQSIHPDDREQVMSALHDYLNNQIPIYEVEFRARHQDGSYRWISARGAALRTELGIPYRLSGSHIDITERKKLEEELRESRQFLNSIIDNIPLALYVQEVADDCNFVLCNPAFQDIFGCQQQQIVGLNMCDLLPKSQAEIFHGQALKVLSENQTVEIPEIQMNRPGRSEIWLRTLQIPITNQGKITHLMCISEDITARKHTAVALQESAEREKALAKAIRRMRQTLNIEAIFTATTSELRQAINCDRVVVYRFNADWSGEFVAESVGRQWISLWEEQNNNPKFQENVLANDRCTVKNFDSAAEDDQSNWTTNLVEDTYLKETRGGVYSQGVSYRVVDDIYQAGFDDCYIQLLEQFEARAYIIVPIFSNNLLWGLLAVYQNSAPRQWKTTEVNIAVQIGNQLGIALQQVELLDRTQKQSVELQKALLAADTANRAKSEFLANMSHELRTPLNAIIGFTQILSADKSLSSENREYINIINRAGEHLLALINEILEMSKIEAGRTTINNSEFDLLYFLSGLQQMLQLKAESKGLKLKFEYNNGLPNHICTDEGKLRQILLNLLGNAIKFTETGTVTLRVKTQSNEPAINQYKLIFEIEDTGHGIAPEDISLIFEPFKQTANGSQVSQGTGLGLAISRKYAQLMGGDIQVSSNLGVGSLFTFDVTITEVTNSEFKTPKSQLQIVALQQQQPQPKILVADDMADSRLLLIRILTDMGFSVYSATNGQEAVNLSQSWQPDLILMDMRMPVMDGLAATKKIKSILGKETKVIALTASAFEENRQAILASGCDDFLAKPITRDILLKKISQHLDVEYIYQSQISNELNPSQKQDNKNINEEEIQKLLLQTSSDWRQKVNQSATECNDDIILELIAQIKDEYPQLAQAIEDLTINFQFKKIMHLTQNHD